MTIQQIDPRHQGVAALMAARDKHGSSSPKLPFFSDSQGLASDVYTPRFAAKQPPSRRDNSILRRLAVALSLAAPAATGCAPVDGPGGMMPVQPDSGVTNPTPDAAPPTDNPPVTDTTPTPPTDQPTAVDGGAPIQPMMSDIQVRQAEDGLWTLRIPFNNRITTPVPCDPTMVNVVANVTNTRAETGTIPANIRVQRIESNNNTLVLTLQDPPIEGAQVSIAGNMLTTTVNGNQVPTGPVTFNIPTGINAPSEARLLKHLAPFVPTDRALFTTWAYPNDCPDMNPDRCPVMPLATPANIAGINFANYVRDKVRLHYPDASDAVKDARANDAVELFNSPAFVRGIPNEQLRAAFVMLKGTIGEPALEWLTRDLNSPRPHFSFIGYERLPSFVDDGTAMVQPDTTPGNEGRERITFNPDYQYEKPDYLTGITAHEILHYQEQNNGTYELNLASIHLGIQSQLLSFDPALNQANLPVTERTRMGRRFLTGVLTINNGGDEEHGLGISASSYRRMLPDSPVSMEPSLRDYGLRGRVPEPIPTNDTFRQVLERWLGGSTRLPTTPNAAEALPYFDRQGFLDSRALVNVWRGLRTRVENLH